ncbi:MBG domain-containing protein [Cellulomonas hominis]
MITSRPAPARLITGVLAALLTVVLPSAALADDATGVQVAPGITMQPAPITVTDGDDARFDIAYTGEPEPTVWWERSSDDGLTWQSIDIDVNGTASTGTLVLPADLDETGVQVRAQVVNEAGAATSIAAALTVRPAANQAAGGDGVPDERVVDDGSTTVPDVDAVDHVDAQQGAGADQVQSSPADPAQTSAAETGLALVEEAGGASAELSSDDGLAQDADIAQGARLASVEGLASVAAQASSAALAAGTYTITANPYVAGVDAPIGVNVYLADGSFPPVTPQKQNATLTVADDGVMELAIDIAQEIFTLQQVRDGDGIRVLEVERSGAINWMGAPPADAPYQDRITRMTVALDDARGEYAFSDSVEYPSILNTEKYWTIHLAVDFASAVRQIEGDASQTYLHEATGVSVTVAVEAGSDLIGLLPAATLDADEVTSGSQHNVVAAAVERSYVTPPTFTAWRLDLRSVSASIDLGGRALTTVSLPVDVTNPQVYLLTGGTLEPLAVMTVDGGRATFATEALGTFVVVDGDSGTPWQRAKTFTGTVGTTMTYRSTDVFEAAFLGMDFDTLDSLGLFASFLGEESSAARAAEATKAVSAINEYQDPELRLYTFGLDMSFENLPFATDAKHRSFMLPLGNGQSSLSGSVPVSSIDDEIYLVSGTVADGLTAAVRLDAVSDGASAAFNLVGKDADTLGTGSMPQLPLWNAATGKSGDIDTAQTPDTLIAYVVVIREAPVAVDKPVAAPGLVYDGTAQTGVAEGAGYTLSIAPSATAAGEYVARAALAQGHVWADGTTDPVVLAWSIAKAELTATYAGEQVAASTTPALEVRVEGFVNGETPTTAARYVAPAVTAPGPLTSGQRYTLIPAGGDAANYAFAYRGGTLVVAEGDGGNTRQPGTYRITANLYAPAQENDILHVAAYMTSPKNPLVATDDANYGVPTSPVSDNAILVVGADGSRSLVLTLPNPAFTLLDFGTLAGGATVRGVERDGKTYGADSRGRITSAVIDLDTVGGSVVFADSHVYAAPLSLAKTWDLTLTVDAASASLISDGTTVPVIHDDTSGDGNADSSEVASGAGTAGTDGTATASTTAESGTLRAGTYIVSANIWLSRADTGLPLDPHLTSGEFPPMDPVQDNATLVVATDGSARVTVPITIQSRIMTVRELTGSGLSTAGGDTVTAVTVDLGQLSSGRSVVSRSMTASVTIGDLAMSIGGPIFGDVREHTWPATFQMDLAGVPTTSGGDVPEWVLTALTVQDTTAAVVEAGEALDAARAANEESQAAAREQGTSSATAGTQTESGSGMSAELIAALIVLVAAAGAAGGLWGRRRHRASTTTARSPAHA